MIILGNSNIKNILRFLIKSLFALLIVIAILPFLLYIPRVQEWVKDIVISKVSQTTGMEISIDRILLKFPLELEVDNTLIIEASRDTMLQAEKIGIDVKLLPLLRLDIAVKSANIHNAKYRMLSADSSMLLTARIDKFKLSVGNLNLATGRINIDEASLQGADLNIYFDNEKSKPTPEDTTNTTNWIINAHRLSLKDIHYSMQMMPVIDNIDTHIAEAELKNGYVNTGERKVRVNFLSVDEVKAVYLTPSDEAMAQYAPGENDNSGTDTATASEEWTVTGDSIRLTNSGAIYAKRGAIPQKGFDFNYIQANNINIGINEFFNKGTAVTVPLKYFTATERCGIDLNASGIFKMDSVSMNAEDFKINTPFSNIGINASIGNTLFMQDPSAQVALELQSDISLGEIKKIFPVYSSIINMIPQLANLHAVAGIKGTLGNINIRTINVKLPKYAQVSAQGNIKNITIPKNASGDISLTGFFENINFIKPSLLDIKMQKSVNFPPLHLNGKLSMHNNNMAGDIKMRLPSGEVALNARVNSRSENFNVELALDSFPVNAILPLSGFGTVTAEAKASGKGFDITKPSTSVTADINIVSLAYNNYIFRQITSYASLKDKIAELNIKSANENCDFDFNLNGTIDNDEYKFNIESDINDLNLEALNLSGTPLGGKLNLTASGEINTKKPLYDINCQLNNINWTLGDNYISTSQINADVFADSVSVKSTISNNDLSLNFMSSSSLDTLLIRFTKASEIFAEQTSKKIFDITDISRQLPEFGLKVKMGNRNIVQQYLANDNIQFKEFNFNASNDSVLSIDAYVNSFNINKIRLDTITFTANEQNKNLFYKLHVGNRKGTIDQFAYSNLTGSINKNKLTALFNQQNISMETGFNIGISAELSDSAVRASLFPENPIIGYKPWAINKDNYIEYNFNRHFDANLSLRNDSSYVSLYTKHISSDKQEDIILKISGIQIAEWLTLSPFAPPVSGVLASDMTLSYEGKNFWGNGSVSLSKLLYNKQKVGDFKLNLNLELDPADGYTNANIDFDINGRKTIMAHGVLNDSTSSNPFNLDLKVDRLPLDLVNPFIPQNIANVNGYLNGEMDVTGSFSEPILNGYIQYDSTHINMPAFGSYLTLSDIKIPVDSNLVQFKKFEIIGINKKALAVNGNIDLKHSFFDPGIHLIMKGNNIQIVNSKKTSKAELFGKAFIDASVIANGVMSNLNVNANVSLLEESNITYVLQSDVNAITQGNSGNIVKFVQFNDSANFNKIDSLVAISPFGMNINALLNVNSGASLNVFLSPDGQNKVQIEGYGTLSYSQNNLGDSRLSGRYTINKGFVKYKPPLISGVSFDFESGSYVSWTGNMMNPSLNIKATETRKANVTTEGQDSRVVTFNILLTVTNTLKNLGLAFDLSTNDDITVQNELQSMSPEQRSTQAMNLMLYNTYTGFNSSSSGLKGNPLYSFLESQLNSWAAQNIKGINLSFGIDQYDRTVQGNTSLTTNYSYQISKSLLNDRFKIVVGGNYNTDNNNNDEKIAQDLINNISFEYMLNKSGNMYVKLFYYKGYESILEGEITQTGVGFVLKRKLNTLKNIFRFNLNKKPSNDTTKIITEQTENKK